MTDALNTQDEGSIPDSLTSTPPTFFITRLRYESRLALDSERLDRKV